MTTRSPRIDDLTRQLAELDALLRQGTLTSRQARNTRRQLERELLQAITQAGGDANAAGVALSAEAAPRPSSRLVLAMSAFVLVFSLAGYAWRGNLPGLAVGPGDPASMAQAPEGDTAAAEAQINTMLQRLTERLKEKPDDAEGWTMLARSYSALGRHAEALPAYQKVIALKPDSGQALADYADGLATANGRSLKGEPEKLIAQALKLDPINLKALSLAGTVAFQAGDHALAVKHWEGALKVSEPGTEFTQQLRGALNEARQRAGLPPLPEPPLAVDPGRPMAPDGTAGGGAAANGGAAGVATAAAPAAGASAAGAGGAGQQAAAGGSMTPAAAGGAQVTGRVTLSAALKAQAQPDDTVFIFARPATGARMPLAILRKKVSELPVDFTLDDSLAMSPAARLSSAQQVVVGARISRSGNPIAQPGDLQVLSAPVAVGSQGLRLDINETVK